MAAAMVLVIVIAVVLIVLYLAFDRRRYTGARGAGLRPTSEVFRDPVSGRRMRVWQNPATGAREYREEAES